jgi:hypothetical protein
LGKVINKICQVKSFEVLFSYLATRSETVIRREEKRREERRGEGREEKRTVKTKCSLYIS